MNDDKTLIIFSFPRNVLMELDLATRMGEVKKILEDVPEIQILSVMGGSAAEIVKLLERKGDPSNLVLHAIRELDLAGNDEDFNSSIIAAIEGFASYGHSGGSASVAIPMLNDLLQYKNLTPLTDDPKEWMKVEMGDTPTWISVRNPEAFSNDAGKTYYKLSEQTQTPGMTTKTVPRKETGLVGETIVDGHSPIMKYFAFDHLPEKLQGVSRQFRNLAWWVEDNLPVGPEKSTALRKLLEAKDAAVRSALDL